MPTSKKRGKKRERWQQKKNLTTAVCKLRKFSFFHPFFDINFNTVKVLNEKHQGKLDCEAAMMWGRGNYAVERAQMGAGKSQKGHTKFSATFSFSNYEINASCHITSNTTLWFIIWATRWRDWAMWRKYEREMVWEHLISMHV